MRKTLVHKFCDKKLHSSPNETMKYILHGRGVFHRTRTQYLTVRGISF